MNENQTAQALAYLSPDVCFIMDDDSMEGAGILAGDIVAFTACDHAENGQIVAIQTAPFYCFVQSKMDGFLSPAPRATLSPVCTP